MIKDTAIKKILNDKKLTGSEKFKAIGVRLKQRQATKKPEGE